MNVRHKIKAFLNGYKEGQKLMERAWDEELGEDTTILNALPRMLFGKPSKRKKHDANAI